jgi:threonylcarbamoyladenosine tRNA methylthiotransferase MtaB
LQSGSDRVLALMKRKYNSNMALEGMERLRRAIPHVQFTTDVIVGFPQESEEDFADTVAFAEKAKFLMIHIFPYSKRAGTVAASMSGQIPEPVKHARLKELSGVQEEIRKEILASYVNTVQDVLFETYSNGMLYGHTKEFIEVSCPGDATLGAEIHPVFITGSDKDRCFGTLYSKIERD